MSKIRTLQRERKKRTLAKGEQLTNIIDERLEVPEGHAKMIENGTMHFLLNRHTMELVTEVTDELLRSRNIPPNPSSISAADPVTVHILIKQPDLDELDALEQAIHWYKTQADRCRQDAMIIAISDTNDIALSPKPYLPGEVAFDNKATDGTTIPKWRRVAAELAIPVPDRNLVNIYENRLKVIYDFLDLCGVPFTSSFWRVFNRAMAESIRLLNQQDDDGFQSKPVGGKVSVGTRTADENQGDTAEQPTEA
jgi:hypothetical protein